MTCDTSVAAGWFFKGVNIMPRWIEAIVLVKFPVKAQSMFRYFAEYGSDIRWSTATEAEIMDELNAIARFAG